jgi:hypothetical protein
MPFAQMLVAQEGVNDEMTGDFCERRICCSILSNPEIETETCCSGFGSASTCADSDALLLPDVNLIEGNRGVDIASLRPLHERYQKAETRRFLKG